MKLFEQQAPLIAVLGLIVVWASFVFAFSSAPALNGDTPIRPFKVTTSDEALTDLRRRINATKWPEHETVSDNSQGVPLVTMEKLARYWATEYDWRKVEKRLNAYPQFVTNIDGLDIHFIHVRSKEPNALPVIITHGWPGSIIEQMKIIDPLTNPAAHGDGRGCVRRRDPVASGPRVFGQADRDRLGSTPPRAAGPSARIRS